MQYYDELWSQEAHSLLTTKPSVRTAFVNALTKIALLGERNLREYYILQAIQKHHPNPMNILEIGCGKGQLASKLAQMTWTVAVDKSDGARALWNHFEDENFMGWLYFYQFDFRELTRLIAAHGKFDLIVSAGMVEHIPYYLHHPFFEKVYELLKPNGILVCDTPNAEYVLPRLTAASRQPIEDQLTCRELAFHCAVVGLSILEHRLLVPDFPCLQSKVFLPFNAVLRRLPRFFRSRCQIQMIVARKRTHQLPNDIRHNDKDGQHQ